VINKAYSIHLNGIVQGVGFRPFVYRLAQELKINGWVNNSSHGVYIHAEGEHVQVFIDRLVKEIPPLAKITEIEKQEVDFGHYQSFEIVKSSKEENEDVLIPPDVATCPECIKDMMNPNDRRFQYPFTNCTNCGPRYTIIRDVPYDRSQTTMDSFSMCLECAKEYENPLDRRFHAQPVACIHCGPKVQLMDAQGKEFPGLGLEQLAQGAIIAVKGLGGFHLVCDARNTDSLRRLRQLKERGAKPFALMASNLDKVREQLHVTDEEEDLLLSPASPIVILERRTKLKNPLPEEIAPGLHTLGVMLPYTPLHTLLFQGPYDFLVMTSANLSGRPLIYTNKEAIEGLKEIADYFLLHNREIYHPCDDSVVQIIDGEPVFHRRARGYVPLPQETPSAVNPSVLGVGGELKNAFCFAAGQRAFVSQYIGDMEGYENFLRFRQELNSFQRVSRIVPEIVAYDAHPNYQTTRFALESPLPKIKVQHHHAHFVSVLGEHQLTTPALGVICDGTGWGEDEKIWGFEFFRGDAKSYERIAHLEYLPLPGGDTGAKHPLRIAYAYAKVLLSQEAWYKSQPLWDRLSLNERRILDQQIERKIQIFETSSAGRLFDAISALLDICSEVTYEGQAAIELESYAFRWAQRNTVLFMTSFYSIDWMYDEKGSMVLKIGHLFQEIIQDILEEKEQGFIAYKFHESIAQAIIQTLLKLQVGQEPLVLTGGVFQNKLLTERLLSLLRDLKVQVYRAKELPPGDGGLSFGQVLIANEVCKVCV
jgi:hydrogenase maturation protein HypF